MNKIPDDIIAYTGNTDPFYPYIYKIEIQNLMNFSKFDMRPSYGINLIFGPNGCGKSSIIVGVRLALGSTPEECERGKTLEDYVRNNKDEKEAAYVIVYLHIQNKCTTLVNSMDPDDHTDCNCRLICKIDLITGERDLIYGDVHLKDKDEIKKYLKENFNINTNNLYQVLPQEKTCSVLTNDSKRNLLNIEKAVNYNLYKLHKLLLSDSSKIMELVKQKEKQSEQLHITEMKLVKAESKQNLSAKLKEINEKITQMNKIMAWAKYAETKNTFKGELNLYNDLSTTDIIEKKIEGYKNEISKLEIEKNSFKTKSLNYSNLKRELNKVCNYADDIIHRVNNHASDVKFFKDKIERQQETIESKENRLENLKSMPQNQDEGIKKKIEELSQKINNSTVEERKLIDQLNKNKSELKPLESQISEREELLKTFSSGTDSIIPNDTKRCLEFIKYNKSSFKSPIFAPIFQYIGVNEDIFAQYLQSSVGFFTQCGILCTCDEDGIKVRNFIREKRLSKVSVFTVTSNNSTKSLNIDFIKKADLGISSTLDNYLIFPKGAEPVKELLRRESGIQNILIGDNTFDMNKFSNFLRNNDSNRNSNNNIIDIRSLSSIIVFTSTLKIIFNKIRGRQISIQTEPFRLNLSFRLVESGSLDKRDKLEKELAILKKRFDDKNMKCKELENRIKSLTLEKDKLKEEYNNCSTSLHFSRSKETSLNQMIKDISNEKKSLEMSIKQLEAINSQEAVPSMYRNYSTRLKEMIELAKKMEIAEIGELIIGRVEKEINLMKLNIKAEEENLTKIQTVRNNHENRLRHTEKKMKDALEYAKSVLALRTNQIALNNCPIETNSYCSYTLPPTYKEFDISYEELQRTLNLFINEQRKLAKKRTIQNTEVTDNYTDLLSTVTILKEKVYLLDKDIDKMSEIFQINFTKWNKKIKRVVEEMNKHFCRYLDAKTHKEGALGSITLDPSVCDIPSNPSEFFNAISKYEIRISGKLKTFDDKRDITGDDLSGGEKSFATAIFLLSMRTLIEAPFCMMDEINQGMDESYEYDFFNLLMNGKQYVQYFIFSPTQNMKIEDILRDMRNSRYHNCLIKMHVILCGNYVCKLNKENIISLEEVLSLKRKREESDDDLVQENKRIKIN